MKSIFARTALKIAVLSTLSSLSFAAQGPGSGNGDGDRAFALQKVAKANPGLTPQQVLLKAFEESAGRIPSLTYGTPTRPDATQEQAAGYLTSVTSSERHAPGIELYMDDKSATPRDVRGNLYFVKTTPVLGPMFPNPKDQHTFLARGSRYTVPGDVTTGNGSLVLNVSSGATRYNPWVELRSLDANTIVFITRAVKYGNVYSCKPLSIGNVVDMDWRPVAGDICTVGYFWKE